MDILLSSKDTEWLSAQYPGLKIDIENKVLIGDIYLNRSYKNIRLNSIYSIKIMLTILPSEVLPKVYITNNKIKNIASSLKLSNIEDLHVNSDNSLCLAIHSREEECFSDKFTIKEFFENCLEPYLYWVTYYEKYHKAPWKEYAHGNLGFIELYSENKISFTKLLQKIPLITISKYLYHYDNINNKCLCGKNINMKKCHVEIYNGLKKFKYIWKNKYKFFPLLRS